MKDYHIHTTFSDGHNDVSEIIETACKMGLDEISITDHDSIDAFFEIYSYGDINLKIFSGVELDCNFNGFAIEILGYGFNINDPALNDYLRFIQNQRNKRAEKYIEVVNERFKKEVITHKDVFSEKRKTILKPHILRPLIEKGLFENYKKAKEFIAAAADLPLERIEAKAAIEMLHNAGGKAFLAHPGVYDFERNFVSEMIMFLKKLGIDGIEFYYPYFNMRDERYASQEAVDDFYRYLLPLVKDLEISQGSDSHSVVELDSLWNAKNKWAVM